MAITAPAPMKTFTERAAAQNLNETEILNSNNAAGPFPPPESDVVLAGGGIHGLIYAIHASKHKPDKIKISVIEKNAKPGYKIGESTLPLFSMWCKMYGLTSEYMLRIFGLKDGLCFFYLDREKQEEYTDFIIGGTPGVFLSGYQVERPISELLFTLLAQRNGVNVYHGREVDFKTTKVQGKHDGKPTTTIDSSLLVDATGRFRQVASKNASLHRFEGWNYDAFWAYFTCPKDESNIKFRFYEGSNTNHICFPEGWIWVIRLLSWEGNPIARLMDMLSYLLDLAEAGVTGDQVPSTDELATMFELKYQWVMSIGFAVRNDIKYPEDMSLYGTGEAERRFNYFVEKYSLIKEFMTNFGLIENHYGPNTTWFIRKSLTYQSPVVSGPGWLAIGDACGFTNPLFSPGINASMSTSTFAAELMHKAFEVAQNALNPEAAELSIRTTLAPFDDFAKRLIPALNQMNRFNYCCFRDPRLGAQISGVWQNLASTIAGFGLMQKKSTVKKFTLTPETFLPYALNWAYGSMVPEFGEVARKVIRLIAPIPLEESIPDDIVRECIEFTDCIKAAVIDSGRCDVRFAGMFRTFDNRLNYTVEKTTKDDMAHQCSSCASWFLRHPEWKKCYSCGKKRSDAEATIIWNPPLTEELLY
ncbi:hypothetical protein F5882DRAFT_471149 [Hyaloscypha sp. PMI_1271]|nr:hypothetical protein F5882DRAFT_471149 [Hyaloscypha sp. PMI_1271]